MLLEEISPFIRFCAGFECKPHNRFSICLDCRLFYIKDGTGEILFEEKKYSFKKNTVILFGAGTKYKFITEKPINIISINFDYTQKNSNHKLPYATIAVKDNESAAARHIEKIQFENSPSLERPTVINDFSSNGILKSLLNESNTKPPFYEAKMSSLLKTLIIDIARASILPENTNIEHKLNTVLSYIHENYTESISNEEIAKLVSYHPYYLNRIFKTYMGTTLYKYILDYRISMAENLLISTDIPIERISEQVGFNSINGFTSYFKKTKKLTPTQFRKRVKKSL